MSSARVRCRTCGQPAVWSEEGRWLHAADAIRSPWQPQSSQHAHPVDPERDR